MKVLRTLLALIAVAAAGCGNDKASTLSPDLAVAASPHDLALATAKPDLAKPLVDLAYVPITDGGGFLCGSMSCSASKVCCVTGGTPTCAGSCPDGGFIAQCRGPQDCQGNPCCINITAGYQLHDVSCTEHQTDCAPSISLATGSGQDRACNVDGDCTVGAPSTMLPNCCTNTATGQHICSNALVPVTGFTCP